MGRKEEIIAAAEKVFIKYGLEKITLDDIAFECGIKKTALYYYFKNKDEILSAMIKMKAMAISDHIRSKVMECDNVRDRLRTFMRSKISIMQENMRFMKLFEREGLPKRAMEFLNKVERSMTDSDFSLVKEVISQGIKNNRISYQMSDSLVLMILGVAYGSFIGKHYNECNWNTDAMIETTIDVIFRGIE